LVWDDHGAAPVYPQALLRRDAGLTKQLADVTQFPRLQLVSASGPAPAGS
jgi:hypothetical protein